MRVGGPKTLGSVWHSVTAGTRCYSLHANDQAKRWSSTTVDQSVDCRNAHINAQRAGTPDRARSTASQVAA